MTFGLPRAKSSNPSPSMSPRPPATWPKFPIASVEVMVALGVWDTRLLKLPGNRYALLAAPDAPTIRSIRPSPSTSPGEARLAPNSSPATPLSMWLEGDVPRSSW